MAIRIIGLDPGLRRTGWGVIDIDGHRLRHVCHGVIPSSDKASLAERLNQIYEGLVTEINKYQPQEAAVEETFVNNNPTATLKLGQARGVVLLAPAHLKLTVQEYSANRIKKAVVGAGHATKEQVMTMVKHLLPNCGDLTSDSADALAVAVCHAHYRTTTKLWEQNQ